MLDLVHIPTDRGNFLEWMMSFICQPAVSCSNAMRHVAKITLTFFATIAKSNYVHVTKVFAVL